MSNHERFPVLPRGEGLPARAAERRRADEMLTFLAMACIYCEGEGHKNRMKCAGSGQLPDGLQRAVDACAERYPNWRRAALCPACLELAVYAAERTARCPHMAYKTYCHQCPRPCHPAGQMKRITPLMRYSGPRLLLRYPALTLRHIRAVLHGRKIIKRYKERHHV